MSIEYHVDQKVVCISEFPQVIAGRVVVKPLKMNSVYTVLLPVKNVDTVQDGLIIKNHERLHNTCEVAVYSECGFMPFDLWVKNSNAVDKLMEGIL